MSGDQKTIINGIPSQYVKLNVGGRLYYTTISTLTSKKDTMLQAMFSGRMEVLTDAEGMRSILVYERWMNCHWMPISNNDFVCIRKYDSHNLFYHCVYMFSTCVQAGFWSIAVAHILVQSWTTCATVQSSCPTLKKVLPNCLRKQNITASLSWPIRVNERWGNSNQNQFVVFHWSLRKRKSKCWSVTRRRWIVFHIGNTKSVEYAYLTYIFVFQPVVKLLINRHNNKYSYTNTSDDNLLKNIELFDKLSLRFSGRILFIKDVIGSSEICCWSFYGNGRKVAEVSTKKWNVCAHCARAIVLI